MSGHVTVQAVKILRLITRRPSCGADIMRELGIKSGSLYPCLKRFETWGLVYSSLERGTPQALGRPLRRFYVVTEAGLAFLRGIDLQVSA